MAEHTHDKVRRLPVIERHRIDPEKVVFTGADGKPVTELDMFERFSCRIPNANPETPDRVEPDMVVEREFFQEDMPLLPGGGEVRIFGFRTPGEEARFPAPTMRLVEGRVVHSIIRSKKNTHTIHHHGIEPTNFNDGVGHTSFEVSGNYAYQFKPRVAGTYHYHCHKNTVFHFEMGMYGFLVVDPPVEGAPFADGGPGMVRRMNEIIPYDVEALWAVDEFDTRWHEKINHKAGLACPFYDSSELNAFVPNGKENEGLHEFRPDVFLISGAPFEGKPVDKAAVRAKVGQTVLVRLLNAGYTVQEYLFPELDAEVIEIDGRPLGLRPSSAFSRPFTIPAGEPFRLSAARRYGMLIRPRVPGRYPFTIRFHDWITDEVLEEIDTFIEVEGA